MPQTPRKNCLVLPVLNGNRRKLCQKNSYSVATNWKCYRSIQSTRIYSLPELVDSFSKKLDIRRPDMKGNRKRGWKPLTQGIGSPVA